MVILLAAYPNSFVFVIGMNKLIINHLDKIFVTNDAATIIREMEIEHPAAKMVVMAAAMQESEVEHNCLEHDSRFSFLQLGDGSNFVVILAGELLAKAGKIDIRS